MVRKAIIVIALCLTGLVQAQAQPRQPREVWNEIFTERQGREFPHNKFLAVMIRGRKPGKALDIGIGEGRNALFLAGVPPEQYGLITGAVILIAALAEQWRRSKQEAVA